jgi:hypothetical protein
MPLAFPVDPALNDTYTLAGRTWKYNASGWVLERDVEFLPCPEVPYDPDDPARLNLVFSNKQCPD